MDKIQFAAETRDGKGKGVARKLRTSGFIPGILYGAGHEPCPIRIEKKSAENIIRKLESHNIMADLLLKAGKGKAEAIKTLVKDIQIDAIKGDVLHMDFYRIRMDQQVRMGVAVHLVGLAPGVEQGGILDQEIRELQVQALPDKIPSKIEVDISGLSIGSSLTVKDIVLPEGVSAVEEAERIVVAVLAPKAEKVEEEVVEETAAAEETAAEPEVISEKEATERRREKEAEKEKEKK
ncbi:MAG: 50S ribosomal protein L25 [Candidatus Omnitrophica bacterium]|nr:50S ribosomal protein L25 [Candidatus Omnitrophota bacterium]